MGYYKAPNKHIIPRGHGGRFRKSTLSDIGMFVCEKCGAIFTPDYSVFDNEQFIDPVKFRNLQKVCKECLNK
jgi:hypothetical protein